jgi:hypothetical protein
LYEALINLVTSLGTAERGRRPETHLTVFAQKRSC